MPDETGLPKNIEDSAAFSFEKTNLTPHKKIKKSANQPMAKTLSFFNAYQESLTIQQIVSHDNSIFYLMTNGEVFACGNNKYGQLGIGNTKKENTPIKVSLPSVTKIITDSGSTFFFTANGEVFACGNNRYGQLGIGNTENQLLPIKLPRFDRAMAEINSALVGSYL